MEDRYLYKAKRVDNGEWVTGYYCRWTKGERVITYSESEVDCIITWMSNGGMTRHEVDPSTICKCTGLRDKNGKLIWENDIIKYTDMITRTKKIACIEWSNAQASFVRAYRSQMGLQYLYIDEFIANSGEVIGNKFDDVELLEVQE